MAGSSHCIFRWLGFIFDLSFGFFFRDLVFLSNIHFQRSVALSFSLFFLCVNLSNHFFFLRGVAEKGRRREKKKEEKKKRKNQKDERKTGGGELASNSIFVFSFIVVLSLLLLLSRCRSITCDCLFPARTRKAGRL